MLDYALQRNYKVIKMMQLLQFLWDLAFQIPHILIDDLQANLICSIIVLQEFHIF
jgi:hypothetical protein